MREVSRPKVWCYKNLHRRCWSRRIKGRLAGYASSMTLANAEFRVWQGGRRRALLEGRRNVHAFAIGEDLGCAEPDLIDRMSMVEVSYNPFRGGSFYEKKTGRSIERARWAFLMEDGSLWATVDTFPAQ